MPAYKRQLNMRQGVMPTVGGGGGYGSTVGGFSRAPLPLKPVMPAWLNPSGTTSRTMPSSTPLDSSGPPTGLPGAPPQFAPSPGLAAPPGSNVPPGAMPYPMNAHPGRKRGFGGHKYMRKLNRFGPPWLQEGQGPDFGGAIGTINDILASGGATDPRRLAREQADIELGRQQAQDASLVRAAQFGGADPNSSIGAAQAGQIDQGANLLRSRAMDAEMQRQEERKRTDLNLIIPWLQALLAYTTKRGGNVQAAPAGGGGGTDWAGAGSNIIGSLLQGWLAGRNT